QNQNLKLTERALWASWKSDLRLGVAAVQAAQRAEEHMAASCGGNDCRRSFNPVLSVGGERTVRARGTGQGGQVSSPAPPLVRRGRRWGGEGWGSRGCFNPDLPVGAERTRSSIVTGGAGGFQPSPLRRCGEDRIFGRHRRGGRVSTQSSPSVRRGPK